MSGIARPPPPIPANALPPVESLLRTNNRWLLSLPVPFPPDLNEEKVCGDQKQGVDTPARHLDALLRLIQLGNADVWRKFRDGVCATFSGRFTSQFEIWGTDLRLKKSSLRFVKDCVSIQLFFWRTSHTSPGGQASPTSLPTRLLLRNAT